VVSVPGAAQKEPSVEVLQLVAQVDVCQVPALHVRRVVASAHEVAPALHSLVRTHFALPLATWQPSPAAQE
jgi:hypothetical protein